MKKPNRRPPAELRRDFGVVADQPLLSRAGIFFDPANLPAFVGFLFVDIYDFILIFLFRMAVAKSHASTAW